jgi:methionyl-tRNA formyltransferase
MGGAHSTWQILNQESIGSIIFQEMDFPVDRGCVLAKYDFLYQPEHRTPQARMEENLRQIVRVIHEALQKVMASADSPGITLDFSSREYWPRLNSEIHGWIDWNWSGEEIASFIGAFGPPYIGAHSNLLGNTIYLKTAEFIETGQVHPFSAGIILRQDGENQFTIAVRGGHLKITTKPISNLKSVFLEGFRFYSPISKLDSARSTNLRSKDL